MPKETITMTTTVEDAEVELEITEVLDEISISDIVDHYGSDELLDEITEEEAIKYYEIKVAE